MRTDRREREFKSHQETFMPERENGGGGLPMRFADRVDGLVGGEKHATQYNALMAALRMTVVKRSERYGMCVRRKQRRECKSVFWQCGVLVSSRGKVVYSTTTGN